MTGPATHLRLAAPRFGQSNEGVTHRPTIELGLLAFVSLDLVWVTRVSQSPHMKPMRLLTSTLLGLLLLACGADRESALDADTTTQDVGADSIDSGEPDSDQPDTGRDTGATDTGAMDTGAMDTGAMDTGAMDTGRPDTGVTDTGAMDSGRPDTGAMDTGRPDTGRPDTGRPDTGRPDTGRPDTGSASVPCAGGPGRVLWRITWPERRAGYATVEEWEAACEYSLADMACSLSGEPHDYARWGPGVVFDTSRDYFRVRFSVEGMSFSSATLYMSAHADGSGLPLAQLETPLHGNLEFALEVPISRHRTYAIDWSDYLTPSDRPALTAVTVRSRPTGLAVSELELCVD